MDFPPNSTKEEILPSSTILELQRKLEETKRKLGIVNLREELDTRKKRLETIKSDKNKKTEQTRIDSLEIQLDRSENPFKFFLIEKMQALNRKVVFGDDNPLLGDVNQIYQENMDGVSVNPFSLPHQLEDNDYAITLTSNGFYLRVQEGQDPSNTEKSKLLYETVRPDGSIDSKDLNLNDGEEKLLAEAKKYQEEQLAEFEKTDSLLKIPEDLDKNLLLEEEANIEQAIEQETEKTKPVKKAPEPAKTKALKEIPVIIEPQEKIEAPTEWKISRKLIGYLHNVLLNKGADEQFVTDSLTRNLEPITSPEAVIREIDQMVKMNLLTENEATEAKELLIENKEGPEKKSRNEKEKKVEDNSEKVAEILELITKEAEAKNKRYDEIRAELANFENEITRLELQVAAERKEAATKIEPEKETVIENKRTQTNAQPEPTYVQRENLLNSMVDEHNALISLPGIKKYFSPQKITRAAKLKWGIFWLDRKLKKLDEQREKGKENK